MTKYQTKISCNKWWENQVLYQSKQQILPALTSPVGGWEFGAADTFSDASLTTPITEGGTVRGVRDILGSGNNLTLASGTAPVWSGSLLNMGPGVTFPGNVGGQTAMQAAVASATDQQNFSLYGVVWFSRAYAAGAIGLGDSGSGDQAILVNNGTGNFLCQSGSGGNIPAGFADPNRPLEFAITSTATGLTIWLGTNAPVSYGPLATGPMHGVTVGNWFPTRFDFEPFQCPMWAVYAYGQGHTAAQVQKMLQYLRFKRKLPYSIPSRPSRIVINGDSRAYGYNIDNAYYFANYGQTLARALGSAATVLVYGYTGASYTTTDSYMAVAVDPAAFNICLGWFGINEFLSGASAATVLAHARAYAAARKADGYNRVVLSTELNVSSSSFNSIRLTYNTSLRALAGVPTANPLLFKSNPGVTDFDYLFDLAADTNIGGIGGLTTPTYSGDLIHPNAFAHSYIESLLAPCIPLIV